MARVENAVFTNMCMVEDGRGNVLVQDRNDPGWPGVVYPGGHVEPGESFVQSVIREVWEETGITVKNPQLCGVKQFFFEDGTRYIVLLFRTKEFTGELRSSAEGKAMWLPRAELENCLLPSGFGEMLKVFDEGEVSEVFWPQGAEDAVYF